MGCGSEGCGGEEVSIYKKYNKAVQCLLAISRTHHTCVHVHERQRIRTCVGIGIQISYLPEYNKEDYKESIIGGGIFR